MKTSLGYGARFAFVVLVLGLAAARARADDALPAPTPAPAPDPTPPAPEAPPLPTPSAAAPAAPNPAPAPTADAAKPAEDPPKPGEPPKEEPKKEGPPKEEPKKDEPKKADAADADAAAKTAPAPVPDMWPVCAAIPPSPCCWRGTVSVRFRDRTDTDGDHDFDLYEYLRVEYRRESDPGWSASFYGRLAEDVDGDGSAGAYDPFRDVNDSYDSAVTGRLYHMYASYRSPCGLIEQVRFGRQDVDGGYPFLVDGVHLTTSPRGRAEFQVTGFVGLPAHLYEGSPEGDFICGAGVEFRPWGGGDARIDWVYVVDENKYYGKPKNHLFTGELRQKLGSCANARLWYEQVDEKPREIGVSANSYMPASDVALRGSFRSQLNVENSLAYDVDSFTAIVQTLYPYWDAHLSASKGFWSGSTIEGGVTARGLWESADEGRYNHKFARVYATYSRDCFLQRNVTFSLTGEYWASHDDVFSAGFDVTWRPSPCSRLSAGIDYSLYRTDLYTGEERFQSYDFYARATFVPAPRWKGNLSFVVEDDSEGTFFTVQGGFSYDF